ncbi:MAG: hypothetical protein J2P36_36350 [Ktedonobacteraceae bacterium]|nr:hypothetical protein [Ktedonobacteraceae bacterium]
MNKRWLAASYHFPSTYSCRIPMTSPACASAMPAPGPATVRLALVRTAVELFGVNTTRQEIFPSICDLKIRIRPPERLSISPHRLRGYKWSIEQKSRRTIIQESVFLREMVHASGLMTLYLYIPTLEETRYQALLHSIGYWGQASSLTTCVGIAQEEPPLEECAVPLRLLDPRVALHPYFSCLVTEFRHPAPTWEEVVSAWQTTTSPVLTLDVYIWPLQLIGQHGGGKCFLRHAFLSPGG